MFKRHILNTDPIAHNNFQDFVQASSGMAFRYWIYKRMFTPIELDKKYMDESVYEDSTCSIGYITQCIPLPDGDFMLGFLNKDFHDDPSCGNVVQFCKLSEIRLELYEWDQDDCPMHDEE